MNESLWKAATSGIGFRFWRGITANEGELVIVTVEEGTVTVSMSVVVVVIVNVVVLSLILVQFFAPGEIGPTFALWP
jgi:hypothetical protein